MALSIVDVVRRSAIPHDAVLGWTNAWTAAPTSASTGAGALGELIRSIQADGVMFVFARIKTPMRHTLEDAGIVELVGRGRRRARFTLRG